MDFNFVNLNKATKTAKVKSLKSFGLYSTIEVYYVHVHVHVNLHVDACACTCIFYVHVQLTIVCLLVVVCSAK